MAKKSQPVDEPVAPDVEPTEEPKAAQAVDFPDFKGDAKQGYLDINDPAHANKTYVELQAKANKGKK